MALAFHLTDNYGFRGYIEMNTYEFLNMICKALELENGSLSMDDSVDTIEAWDSIGYLSIIVVLDSLGVNTDQEETQKLTSIAKLIDLAKNKGIVKD
jgi:acyl carrier protein